jgi:hypothetical protein
MSDRTPTPLTDEELAEVIDRHAPRTPTTAAGRQLIADLELSEKAAALTREPGLDVERLARAMHTSLFDGDVWATLNHDMKELYRRDAAAIAREYAAQEPTE